MLLTSNLHGLNDCIEAVCAADHLAIFVNPMELVFWRRRFGECT